MECMGEKTQSEKIPRLVTLPSPLLRYGGRKQAGPTLSGRGIWSNGKKEKAGSGAVRTGRINLLRFQDL